MYAEEALESTPANRGLGRSEAPPQGLCRENLGGDGMKPRAHAEEAPGPLVKPKVNTLWVKSTERGGNGPLHLVESADWSLPMFQWTSACGWALARASAHVAFVTNPGMSSPKCRKCSALSKLRDEVKEGVKPAQLVASDMVQLAKAGGTRTPRLKHSRSELLQTPPRQKECRYGGGWAWLKPTELSGILKGKSPVPKMRQPADKSLSQP